MRVIYNDSTVKPCNSCWGAGCDKCCNGFVPNTFDFEFENHKLVKIDGMRPDYLDGYKLIRIIKSLSKCIMWREPTEDDIGKEMLVYSEYLVDFDFNPDGVAAGTITMIDELTAMCAVWNNDQDCYTTVELQSFLVLPLPASVTRTDAASG